MWMQSGWGVCSEDPKWAGVGVVLHAVSDLFGLYHMAPALGTMPHSACSSWSETHAAHGAPRCQVHCRSWTGWSRLCMQPGSQTSRGGCHVQHMSQSRCPMWPSPAGVGTVLDAHSWTIPHMTPIPATLGSREQVPAHVLQSQTGWGKH